MRLASSSAVHGLFFDLFLLVEEVDASGAVVMVVSGPAAAGAFRFSPTAGPNDGESLVADDAAPIAASPPPPGRSPWFDMVVEDDYGGSSQNMAQK